MMDKCNLHLHNVTWLKMDLHGSTLTFYMFKVRHFICTYMEGMFEMIYMPNIGHDLLRFFFQFCRRGGLILIARGMDQI